MQQLELLKKYQSLDLQVKAKEDELKAAPVVKKLLRARKYLKNAERITAVAEKNIFDLKRTFNAIATQYQQIAADMTDMGHDLEEADETLPLVIVNRMVQESKQMRIQMDKMEADLEEISKEMDNRTATLEKLETNIPKAKLDYTESKKVYEQELMANREETRPMREQMAVLAKDIDDALLKRYQNLHENYPMVLVPLVNSKCSGCNMDLPSGSLKSLTADNSIVECDNCGRLLFIDK